VGKTSSGLDAENGGKTPRLKPEPFAPDRLHSDFEYKWPAHLFSVHKKTRRRPAG
jgi:hypothetical protein